MRKRKEESVESVEVSEIPEILTDGKWQSIATAPKGDKIYLSEDKLSGELGYWKTTRRIVNGKWEIYGKWVSALNNLALKFIPLYWKN